MNELREVSVRIRSATINLSIEKAHVDESQKEREAPPVEEEAASRVVEDNPNSVGEAGRKP